MSIFFELIENQLKTYNENDFNVKQNERKLHYTNRIPLQSTARCGILTKMAFVPHGRWEALDAAKEERIAGEWNFWNWNRQKSV